MWFKRHTRNALFREVILEAERLLAGEVCDPDHLRGLRPPAWRLISVLAHSSRARLVRISDAALTIHPGSWAATVGSLASELLDATASRPVLVVLQRQALVPMELRLMAGAMPEPGTPAELRSLVRDALGQHPLCPDW